MSSITNSDGIALPADQNGLQAVFRQLHRTTQPLSVLQGVLELALIQARTPDEYRRAVSQALNEVTRVSDCFDELRKQIGLYRQTETDHSEPGEHRV